MRSILAVAKNTVAQALRMKVALLVIVLLVILLPMLWGITEGDGTLKGKLQTFVSYGLSLTSLLLCCLTIAMSIYCVSDDIKRRHIYLVATKPIRRSQILLGKFIGIVLLDILLLAIFACFIWGFTMELSVIDKSSDEEIAVADRQFFTARKEVQPRVDNDKLRELADQRYKQLETLNQLPETMTEEKIRRELLNQERLKDRSVEVGHVKSWVFNNVSPESPDDTLFIQFKYEVASSTPDNKVLGLWAVGDDRQIEQYGPGQWKTNIYSVPRKDATRTQYEFEVPADCVAEDGYVSVIYKNPYENATTVIPMDIKLLYKAGSFNANYIRAVLVILSRLICIAAIGIFLSTWLSFPIAVLVLVVIFCMAVVNSFFVDSVDSLAQSAKLVYNFTLLPLVWMLPKFDGNYDPTPYIVSSKLLSNSLLGEIYLNTVLIKSSILMLLGMLIFRARELAKITV